MEEVRAIAKAHYRAGSPEVQHLAYEFFKALDTNGDGKVQLHEFLSFMKQEYGYDRKNNLDFFKELDRDKNGTLDFEEVMTLFYIVKSGRPFCDWCWKFIPGIFFSCVECYENPGPDFTLCFDCYGSKNCDHNHQGRFQFLDSFTLLHYKKKSAGERAKKPDPVEVTRGHQSKSPVSNAPFIAPTVTYVYNITNSGPSVVYPYTICQPPSPYSITSYPSNSNAIVPVAHAPNNVDKWRLALKAFEAALSIGTISATMCTIL